MTVFYLFHKSNCLANLLRRRIGNNPHCTDLSHIINLKVLFRLCLTVLNISGKFQICIINTEYNI
jgi:hypothetical protein